MATATERIQELTGPLTSGRPRIGLDTNCVQYYISDPPAQPWADCLDPVFRAALDGRIDLYVSTVVVAELLAHVHFVNRRIVGYDPELDLLAIINRHFQVLDVTEDIAKAAGRLRGNYIPGEKITLKSSDSLIGATSLANGHTVFITNDSQLAEALPPTNCVYLKEIALEWLAHKYPDPCFDKDAAVSISKGGIGLPTVSLTFLELGAIQPHPMARWKRILKDARIVASTLNEPCIFFVLLEKNGRRMETREVLFWHEGLSESRPPRQVIRRLHDHIGYSRRTRIATKPGSRIFGFIFGSLAREMARQNHPRFALKSNHQKTIDAWNAYLAIWRFYRSCLDLPQIIWLHCDRANTKLDATATGLFLDQAKNVLGWGDG